MYVVTCATGNTGTMITQRLRAVGEKVRVVGRSEPGLQALIRLGAEPFVGSVDDAQAMTRVFASATAVYLLIPPIYWAKDGRAFQNAVSESYARASGLRRPVRRQPDERLRAFRGAAEPGRRPA